MIVACRACKTEFELADDQVPATGGFLPCPKCERRVVVPPPPPPATPPASDVFDLVDSEDLIDLDALDDDLVESIDEEGAADIARPASESTPTPPARPVPVQRPPAAARAAPTQPTPARPPAAPARAAPTQPTPAQQGAAEATSPRTQPVAPTSQPFAHQPSALQSDSVIALGGSDDLSSAAPPSAPAKPGAGLPPTASPEPPVIALGASEADLPPPASPIAAHVPDATTEPEPLSLDMDEPTLAVPDPAPDAPASAPTPIGADFVDTPPSTDAASTELAGSGATRDVAPVLLGGADEVSATVPAGPSDTFPVPDVPAFGGGGAADPAAFAPDGADGLPALDLDSPVPPDSADFGAVPAPPPVASGDALALGFDGEGTEADVLPASDILPGSDLPDPGPTPSPALDLPEPHGDLSLDDEDPLSLDVSQPSEEPADAFATAALSAPAAADEPGMGMELPDAVATAEPPAAPPEAQTAFPAQDPISDASPSDLPAPTAEHSDDALDLAPTPPEVGRVGAPAAEDDPFAVVAAPAAEAAAEAPGLDDPFAAAGVGDANGPATPPVSDDDAFPLGDLPAPDMAAPRLMDDSDAAAAGSDSPVGDMDFPVDAPSAASADDPFAASVSVGDPEDSAPRPDAAAAEPVETPGQTLAASAKSGRSSRWSPKVRKISLVLGGTLAVALVAAVATVVVFRDLPTLGMGSDSVDDPEPEAEAAAAAAPAVAAVPSAAPDPDLSGSRPSSASPPPEVGVPTELTLENVDRLDYPTLRASALAYGKMARAGAVHAADLLLWARFRLAHQFSDDTARATLLEDAPRRPEAPTASPLLAAAGLGALLVAEKSGPARRAADRLRPKAARSPRLAYVVGLVYAARGPPARSAAMLDRALKADPDFVDARLARGALDIGREPTREKGVKTLLGILDEGDPHRAVQVAQALYDVSALDALPEAVAKLPGESALDRVSQVQRGPFLALLVRKAIRFGALAEAARLAEQRVPLEPQSVDAALEAARLLAATGRDPTGLLEKAYDLAEDTRAKARLLVERVEQALRRDDVKSARELIKIGATLPPRPSVGWLRFAEGRIAEVTHHKSVAQAKYSGAMQGRPSFVQPRLALLLLNPVKPAQQLVRLTQMSRRTPLAEVDYHLAQAMAEHGNPGGAARLLNRVLWTHPTVIDPIDLLLEWIDLLDRSGEALRAEALAERVNETLRDDDRPTLKLIELSRRGGRIDAVVKWYKALLDRHPNHSGHTAALASTLTDHGRDVEAQKLLDALLRVDPEARNADILLQLGRSWQARDPVKARGYLEASAKLEPRAEAYMLQGAIEESRGKMDEALEAYRHALKLAPESVPARMQVARTLMLRGFPREATADLRALLAKDPKQAEAAVLLGDAERDLGNAREAIGAYQMALRTREDVAVLLKVARLQIQELNLLQPAIKTLRRATKHDPENADAFYYLGYANKDLGRSREARKAMKEYLRLAPTGEYADEVRQEVEALR